MKENSQTQTAVFRVGVKCSDPNFPGKMYLTDSETLTHNSELARQFLFEDRELKKALDFLRATFSIYTFTEVEADI